MLTLERDLDRSPTKEDRVIPNLRLQRDVARLAGRPGAFCVFATEAPPRESDYLQGGEEL